MITKIEKISQIPTENVINKTSHSLFIIDEKQKNFPFQDLLRNKLKRIDLLVFLVHSQFIKLNMHLI